MRSPSVNRVFPQPRHLPALVYPNPMQPTRYVVMNSGFTFTESEYNGDYSMPRLGDYAVLKSRRMTCRNPQLQGYSMNRGSFLRSPNDDDSDLRAARIRGSCAGERLEIYWVDTEGGGATLILAPSGRSLLIDTGNPGPDDRDAKRIAAVASRQG